MEKEEEKEKKKQFKEIDKDPTQIENLDQYLDMDIRAGMSPEAEKISQNPFLTRGMSDLPDKTK